jgi:anti-anti-sigma regulatory factor
MIAQGIMLGLAVQAQRMVPDGRHLVSDLLARVTFAIVSAPDGGRPGRRSPHQLGLQQCLDDCRASNAHRRGHTGGNRTAVGDATHAVVAFNLRGKVEIGSTFMTALQRNAETLRSRNCRLMLVGVDSTVHEQLAKTGALRLIGEENIFLATAQVGAALDQAVAAATAWLGQER